MSVFNNPNINAAGMTSDIWMSISKYIRGKAREDEGAFHPQVRELVIEFVTNLSTKFDELYGTEVLEKDRPTSL